MKGIEPKDIAALDLQIEADAAKFAEGKEDERLCKAAYTIGAREMLIKIAGL